MPSPSRLCLSRDGPRSAPAPSRLLVSRQGGQDPLLVRDTSSAPYRCIWGREAARSSPRAQPQGWHRPGHQLPPSFKSPPLLQARPGSLGQGMAERRRLRLFVCPTPRSRARERPCRAPGSLPGGRHVAEPSVHPPGPSGTHSGAAAGPASSGLSRQPAPRPARSPRLCRAIARPAGSQPSGAGEGTERAGRIREPAAASAAWRRAAQTWAPGARARPGRGCRGRCPIGPRRD